MSVNLLSGRKTWRISAAIKQPVLRAWVLSHYLSGRYAYLTIGWTKDYYYHRHAWYDRLTGEWAFDADLRHSTSCLDLFPKEMCYHQARQALLEAVK